jgi:hypothetical protein
MKLGTLSAIAFALAITTSVFAQEDPTAAQYRGGRVPELPVRAVGGGEVLLEVTVGRDGSVLAITRLRETAPFAEILENVVANWRFKPAEEVPPSNGRERPSRIPIDSRVLVAAVFRAPALNGPTHGEPIKDVAPSTGQIPYPITIVTPPFPPQAASSGVVLIEGELDRDGKVVASTTLLSVPPFDDAARNALEAWQFRPGRVPNAPKTTYVYAVFGFPIPIGIGPAPKR